MQQGYRLSAATGLHKGDREYQQDQVALFSHPYVNGCVMGVVADGMGGRTGGRKASDQVLMTARQLFERFAPDSEDAADLLQQIVNEAHMVIRLTAIAAEQEPHSTIAAFIIEPTGRCHLVHSGDSRIYHFRGARLVRHTLDHSYVQMLVNRGELTQDQAASHPQSNVLMSCLGMEDTPEADVHCIQRLQVGDCLMACSDGVWPYFTNEEMATVLHGMSPREASEFLIDQARLRAFGGGDNLSLVIVRIDPLELPTETEAPPSAAPVRRRLA